MSLCFESTRTKCESEFYYYPEKSMKLCERKDRKPVIILKIPKCRLASGEYDLTYFKMTGRLQIDMYAYFRVILIYLLTN